jgi:diacylglycerol O-acyltransferase / wax synthase
VSESEATEERRSNGLHRLSGEDAVFVYAETPSMPMHTVGTVILDPSDVPGGFGYPEIAATVASRIDRMPPFRQRLLEIPFGLGHPVLADDPDFRAENHLHRLAVHAPGGMRELAEIVGELAGRPLDRHQPLWEMWVVEGLSGGRIALVTKMHHCMIDGASGSSQMASLMDIEPQAPLRGATPAPWSPPPLPSPLSLAARSAFSRVVNPLRLGRLSIDTAKGMLSRRRARREIARPGNERRGLLDGAPETPFSGAASIHRSVAYGTAPLAALKRVKATFGGTVNDAVLAACALSVRRYLESRDALPDGPLVCMVPVSLKDAGERKKFSNKVSLMSIRLPTHMEDPESIVREVRQQTADAKRIFQAVEGDLVGEWLDLLPPLLTTYGARLYSQWKLADRVPTMMNLVVSNMMGPPIPLYFGGARVEAVYPMGPVGEGLGINMTVLSNMGRVDIGVMTCRENVPDPWLLADGFAAAVADLERAAENREARGDRADERDVARPER